MRDGITLRCDVYKEENYIADRNKKTKPEKLETKNIVLAVINKHYIKKRNKVLLISFL